MRKTICEAENYPAIQRSSFEGVKRVLQFNRGAYAAAASLAAVAFTLSRQSWLSPRGRMLAGAAGGLISYQTLLSLIASHWVYDRSPLHHSRWLKEIISAPGTILNVIAGYDETSEPLRRVFPDAGLSVVDFYEDLNRREPSIVRAQKLFPLQEAPVAKRVAGWPVKNQSVDLVLLAFAAHEIRDQPSRDHLFEEISRVLSRKGVIVLVEHLRDVNNFIAYGPGFLHFLPEVEWLRCAFAANLTVAKVFRITPFVGVFVLCH